MSCPVLSCHLIRRQAYGLIFIQLFTIHYPLSTIHTQAVKAQQIKAKSQSIIKLVSNENICPIFMVLSLFFFLALAQEWHGVVFQVVFYCFLCSGPVICFCQVESWIIVAFRFLRALYVIFSHIIHFGLGSVILFKSSIFFKVDG